MQSVTGSLLQIDQFADLRPSTLERMEGALRWSDYSAGDLVIEGASHKPHGVFLLTDGIAEVLCDHNDYGPLTVAELKAFTCFGEFSAVLGEPGSATVRAKTTCKVAEIPADTFVSMMTECPNLSRKLMSKAMGAVRTLNDELLKLRGVERRVEEVYVKAMPWTL